MQQEDAATSERFVLTDEQVATALTETVLRAQIEMAGGSTQGVLGGILQVDRAFEGVERWGLRAVFAGIPLALGLWLFFVGDNRFLGGLLILASPVVLLAVIVIQRLFSGIGRSIDSATNPMIAKSGGARLRKAIEQGKVSVLKGTVNAEISGDRLTAGNGSTTATIPSIRSAWRADASTYLVLAASRPNLRPDFSQFVVLPRAGKLAKVIVERVR